MTTRPKYTSRDAERNDIARQMNHPLGLGKVDPERQAGIDQHTAAVVAEMRLHQALIASRASIQKALEAARDASVTAAMLRDMEDQLNQVIARGAT